MRGRARLGTEEADMLTSEGLQGPKRAEEARSAVLTSGGPKGRSVLSIAEEAA